LQFKKTPFILDVAEEQIAHHWAIPLYCFSSPLQIPSRDQQDGSPSVFTLPEVRPATKFLAPPVYL